MQAGNELEFGVDLRELWDRVDHDRDLLREVFELFESEFPRIFQELTEATVRGDMNEVKIVAHTLKGMLAGLSFTRAASWAVLIEQMAGGQNPGDINQELQHLEQKVAEGRSLLERVCNEVVA